MESLLLQESEIFQNKINDSQLQLIDAISVYIESYYENGLITEATGDTFTVKIKKIFTSIISAIKNFKASIQTSINSKLRSAEFDKKLRKLYKDAEGMKKDGVKKIEVMDVWTYTDYYEKAVDELKGIALKFSKMKYKTTSEIDADTSKFNTLFDKHEKKLNELSEKKIKAKVDDIIKFIENEISGRSTVMKALNDSITLMEQMKNDCELITTRRDILGPDIIPKHIGFIRRIVNSITGFIKRITVKIITNFVLIVG